MAINDQVSFTWVGHGTFKVRSAAGKEILIDPWVMTNPVAPEHLKTIDSLDIMVITHGHFDHVADAVEIGKATRPKVVANREIAIWLENQGVEGAAAGGMYTGGTQVVDGISFTMVHAEHGSGLPDGGYGGEPMGFVIQFENGFKIYYSGDTDVFGDMALIRELEEPEVAFLSIGDHFTMGPRRAAKAVQLLGVKTVVPMHFATFPALTGRPSQLQELTGPGVKVLDINPGDVL
jgi:L-ascorbate metabolism protein UlaG (beta-lactamase superfamily)